jgi:hypothetical protein
MSGHRASAVHLSSSSDDDKLLVSSTADTTVVKESVLEQGRTLLIR